MFGPVVGFRDRLSLLTGALALAPYGDAAVYKDKCVGW